MLQMCITQNITGMLLWWLTVQQVRSADSGYWQQAV